MWGAPVESLSRGNVVTLIVFTLFVQCIYYSYNSLLFKVGSLQSQINISNALVSQVYDLNSGIQNEALETENRSMEKERKRISRDIHDIMGYTLVNLRVMLEAACDLFEKKDPKVKEILQLAAEHSQTGLQRARNALYNLREYEDPQVSWENKVCTTAKIFTKATKINVSVSFGNVTHTECPLMISAVYQFIQEALTNSFKHGGATQIRISFHVENNFLVIRVCDNGRGSPNEIIEGIGFTGMQERLLLIQGVVIYKNIDDGFEVRCVIPLQFFQKVSV